ncbi:GNAT family N-acetyltransferase [Sphingomonas sp. DBB INV C78]|uniref:GNAT family N-acetyltransferase n=1 Tax=Sphingomonas sp. DBB INV C78 TaxID=3349434 RepID=UPI0036D3772D
MLLRRARWDDLDALHAVLSNDRAMVYWSSPPHERREQTEEWLAAMIDAPPELSDDFVVVRDGHVIGKAGAWRLPEIGYALHPDHWGQGLAREALAAFISHVFTRPDVTQLTADVDPRNPASLRLLASLGFRETGRAERTCHTHIGWCDSVYFALDESDWHRPA